MSRGRVIPVLGAALVATIAAWWWHAKSERRGAEAAMAVEQARQQALRADLRRELARAAAADAELRELRAALAERRTRPGGAEAKPAAPAAAVSRPRPAVPQTWADAVRQWDLERDRPERQLRWFAQLREGNRRRFAPLFRRLGFAAPQQEEFIAHLAKRDERHDDLNAAARAQGIDLNDPGLVRLRGELYRDYEQAQRGLLGELGYVQLQEFERTAGLRSTVGSLAGLAAIEGVPLTMAQTEQLVLALAACSPGYGRGGAASVSDLDWNAVPAALAKVLTPEQRALLATQEAPGGGLFHAQWNGALTRATRAERERAAAKAGR
jgi:hypothetical protein